MEKFDFALLREFVAAEEGQSAYREMADGFPRRRQVRACRITNQQELATAVRLLLAPTGWDDYGLAHRLCQAVREQGQALVYLQAEHGKREKPVFGSVRVGSVAEVLGTSATRALPIPRLRPMAPLYQ